MRRSAVLRDVTHDQLLSELGNLLEDGWVVKQAIPTLQFITEPPPEVGDGSTTVWTHYWTIFLEKDFPDVVTQDRTGYPPS